MKKYRRITGLFMVFVMAFALFAPAAVHASVSTASGKVSLESEVSAYIYNMVSSFSRANPDSMKLVKLLQFIMLM